MLIPRYTIRWLLLATTVCGVFSAVLACAFRGQVWAMAVGLGVVSLAVAFLLYGVLFGGAYVVAACWGLLLPRPRGSDPFATAGPPPQILPPEEPE